MLSDGCPLMGERFTSDAETSSDRYQSYRVGSLTLGI